MNDDERPGDRLTPTELAQHFEGLTDDAIRDFAHRHPTAFPYDAAGNLNFNARQVVAVLKGMALIDESVEYN